MDVNIDYDALQKSDEASNHGNSSDDVIITAVHFTETHQFVIPTMVLYAMFSLFGTFANLVVIVTVTLNKKLHTLTHVFITQLAVGDLVILLFCMPFTVTAAYFFKNWVYGKGICYLVKFAGSCGPTVTVLTLAVMSYERYICILKPLQSPDIWSRGKFLLICGAIYVVAFTRSILRPWFGNVYTETTDNTTGQVTAKCVEKPGTTFIFWYHLSGVVIFYFSVLFVIGILYFKIGQHLKSEACAELTKHNPEIMEKRRRVVRMLLSIVVAFAVGWLPINIVILTFLSSDMKSFSSQNWFVVYVFIARILEYSNCMINPLIYSFLSTNFQTAFRATWSKCSPCISPPRREKSKSFFNSSMKSNVTSVNNLSSASMDQVSKTPLS